PGPPGAPGVGTAPSSVCAPHLSHPAKSTRESGAGRPPGSPVLLQRFVGREAARFAMTTCGPGLLRCHLLSAAVLIVFTSLAGRAIIAPLKTAPGILP